MAIQFKISPSKEMYKMVTSHIYTRKERAIIRELCCNAYDAQIKAGTTHIPMELTIRKDLFWLKDYGTGLSPEEIEGMYTTFFDSNKTYDNTQNGAFGIGSKSPFAYTDTFEISSRYNGKIYHYIADFTGEKPTIINMTDPDATTDEENGVDISFKIKKGEDFYYFIDEIKYAISGLPNVLLKVEGWYNSGTVFNQSWSNHLLYRHVKLVDTKDYCIYRKPTSSATIGKDSFCEAYMLLGNIYYNLNLRDIVNIKDHKELDGKLLIFKGDIGQYIVAASREQLQLTADDRKSMFDLLLDNMIPDIKKAVKERDPIAGLSFPEALEKLVDELPTAPLSIASEIFGDFSDTLTEDQRRILSAIYRRDSSYSNDKKDTNFLYGMALNCNGLPELIARSKNYFGLSQQLDTLSPSAGLGSSVFSCGTPIFNDTKYSYYNNDDDLINRFIRYLFTFSHVAGDVKISIIDPNSLALDKITNEPKLTKKQERMLNSYALLDSCNLVVAPRSEADKKLMLDIFNNQMVKDILSIYRLKPNSKKTTIEVMPISKVVTSENKNEIEQKRSLNKNMIGARYFNALWGEEPQKFVSIQSLVPKYIENHSMSKNFILYDTYDCYLDKKFTSHFCKKASDTTDMAYKIKQMQLSCFNSEGGFVNNTVMAIVVHKRDEETLLTALEAKNVNYMPLKEFYDIAKSFFEPILPKRQEGEDNAVQRRFNIVVSKSDIENVAFKQGFSFTPNMLKLSNSLAAKYEFIKKIKDSNIGFIQTPSNNNTLVLNTVIDLRWVRSFINDLNNNFFIENNDLLIYRENRHEEFIEDEIKYIIKEIDRKLTEYGLSYPYHDKLLYESKTDKFIELLKKIDEPA